MVFSILVSSVSASKLHISRCLNKASRKELYHTQHVILYNGDLSRELSSNVPPPFPKGRTYWQKFFCQLNVVILQLVRYCSSTFFTSVVTVVESAFTYITPGNTYRFLANRRRIRSVSECPILLTQLEDSTSTHECYERCHVSKTQ